MCIRDRIITGDSARLEKLLLNLRLRQGLDLREYAREFGVDAAALLREAHELAGGGLLTGNAGRAVLTRRGRLLADTVIQRLAGVS